MKLHVGCGGTALNGWINLDSYPHPHADCVYDLERCAETPLPYPDDTFERMLCNHTFEHIRNVLPMMQELWRVAKPGCLFRLATPYGSSDNADEDPTHVRRIFAETFTYFSQAWYGRNDYGYRGDWDFIKRTFILKRQYFEGANEDQTLFRVATLRNVVDEFLVDLRAVKPLRKSGFEPYRTKTEFSLR